MIEFAATLSAIVRHWNDLVIISILLVFNALVGFWQKFKAANALEALKKQLALKARALRDGKWQENSAAQLVPGDIIRLRLGISFLRKPNFSKVTISALTSRL